MLREVFKKTRQVSSIHRAVEFAGRRRAVEHRNIVPDSVREYNAFLCDIADSCSQRPLIEVFVWNLAKGHRS